MNEIKFGPEIQLERYRDKGVIAQGMNRDEQVMEQMTIKPIDKQFPVAYEVTLDGETRRYVPATTATRRIRSHDGIGRCTCSECGGSVDITDKYCKHCRAEFVVSEYEGAS